jgi:hypothetical membrane protein
LGKREFMASQFREILVFFEDIGVYDVILPFLLVFTIVFAILDKTKVLGTEEVGGKHYPKKNLNAVVAFVIAFLVIASSRLVEIITNVSANVVVLLFLSVLFLMLAGSFHEDKPFHLTGGWQQIFMAIMFLGIAGIFLNEIQTEDGRPWLEAIGDYLGGTDSDRVIGSAILLIVVVGFMFYVLAEPDSKKGGSGGH